MSGTDRIGNYNARLVGVQRSYQEQQRLELLARNVISQYHSTMARHSQQISSSSQGQQIEEKEIEKEEIQEPQQDIPAAKDPKLFAEEFRKAERLAYLQRVYESEDAIPRLQNLTEFYAQLLQEKNHEFMMRLARVDSECSAAMQRVASQRLPNANAFILRQELRCKEEVSNALSGEISFLQFSHQTAQNFLLQKQDDLTYSTISESQELL